MNLYKVVNGIAQVVDVRRQIEGLFSDSGKVVGGQYIIAPSEYHMGAFSYYDSRRCFPSNGY